MRPARGARHQSHRCPWPPWDRIVAFALGLNLAVNNRSLNCCSVLLEVSCCHPGLRLPGSKSSWFRGGGLAVNTSCQEVGTKPGTLDICLPASAAAARLRPSGSPSNCTTRRVATSGWRANTMGRQSAQLLQWAGNRVLVALRNPNPPKDKGNVAEAFIPASHWLRSTSKMRERQHHNSRSLLWANWATASGLTTRRRKFARAAAQCNRMSHEL